MRRTILRLSSIAILMAGSKLYAQNAAIAPTAPSPSSWGGSTGGYAKGGYNSTAGYNIASGSQNGVPVSSGVRSTALMDSSLIPAGVITTTNAGFANPIGSVGTAGTPTVQQTNGIVPIPATGVAQPGTTWVETSEASCCGPVGRNGPIGSEFIIRTGPTWTIGGGAFKDALNVGYQVAGVGRTLFYNTSGSSAFVVDVGLMYTINQGNGNDIQMIYEKPATIRTLHRTAVQVGLGKEWFTSGPGFLNVLQNSTSHFGIDAGARYGTTHVDLTPLGTEFDYARLHGIYGGAYVGASYGWDLPLGGYTFNFGMRGEYAYTSSDVLPMNSDQHELSLFLTFGMRY